MNVVIFGATGKTGRHLVEGALEEGHEVRAFARDPSKLRLQHERLRVIKGDVLDFIDVEETLAGTHAVLSALGHTKTSPNNVQTVGTGNIIGGMKKYGVRRLVSLTGAGVGDPKDQPKLADRAIVTLLKLLQRDVLEDAVNHAEAIKASGLDWVIVRGPRLTDSPKTGEYKAGYVGKQSGTKVSRADIADFMLKQLEDHTYLHEAPMISY